MGEQNAVVVSNETAMVQSHMNVKEVASRVNVIHEILEKVMKENTHYGTVPGCGPKKVLLKPGADLLAMTFKLVPQFTVTRTNLDNGHREFDVTCSMYAANGSLLGQGVGSASTMEKKYRYRKDDRGKRIENEDIADVYNTVLKIAKKRAHIDATLTCTGAADIFTQDLIENEDGEEQKREPIAEPKAKVETPAGNGPVTNDNPCITLTVCQVSIQKAKKDGTPLKQPRYYFKSDSDGKYYSTFSETIGKQMEELVGADAVIEYTEDKFGRTIQSIKPVLSGHVKDGEVY